MNNFRVIRTKLVTRHVSLWLISAASTAAALLAAPLVRWVDDRTRWTVLGFAADGARGVLGALVSSLLTFIVFAFSLLLVAAQMASGQFTPRMVARVFEDRRTKLTVGAFVFSWVYALAALGRVEGRVPQLPVAAAILMSMVSLGLFLYLMQSAVKILRPVTMLTDVARDTRAVIETLYPAAFSKDGGGHAGLPLDPGQARKTVPHPGRSAAVLSFDAGRLLRIAGRADCTIEIIPQVGDFLAMGEGLFRLYGPGAEAASVREMRRCVALGPERTLEQDPAFGFRIIVDIAGKALSPGINDPTTAVLAIDQLHQLLHILGKKQLLDGVVRDASGAVRLVFRTPDWEDFVTLAATEIRLYGATSPQIGRRLQGMFEHLLRVVPPERSAALRKEVSLLARTIERSYADPEDRAFASQGDLQGIGSRTRRRGH
jgi:uncharacterized membrane protein